METVFAVDCQRFVPNPFTLVHVAAGRARQLSSGAEPRVTDVGHTSAATALMEIAAGTLSEDEIMAMLPWARRESPQGVVPNAPGFDETELLEGMARSFAERPTYAGKGGIGEM